MCVMPSQPADNQQVHRAQHNCPDEEGHKWISAVGEGVENPVPTLRAKNHSQEAAASQIADDFRSAMCGNLLLNMHDGAGKHAGDAHRETDTGDKNER